MGTENPLIDRLAQAIHDGGCKEKQPWETAGPNHRAKFRQKALEALGIPPDVLSWVSAHPEAAKGLAEGTHVAVPKKPTEAMLNASLGISRATKQRMWESRRDLRPTIWSAMLAASTPVPSDEAQDTYLAGLPSEEGGGPWPSDEAQGEIPVDVHAIKVGDKLELTFPENGYPHEREQARAFVGRTLTVKSIDMRSWHTSLTFEEIGGNWNSVQFRETRP